MIFLYRTHVLYKDKTAPIQKMYRRLRASFVGPK